MLINNISYSPKRYSSGEIKKFEDGLKPFLKYSNINILYNNDISLLELMLVTKYFKENKKNINLTLSYLPYQRMNHSGEEAVKYVASIFNSLNLTSLKVIQPHCELDYFNNASPVCFVSDVFTTICQKIDFDKDRDLLVFTDKGSREKFNHLSKNAIYCKKTRDKKTGLISSYSLVGNIRKEQKIIIVDDIISSGDTIIETINAIQKQTKQKVYLLCAHFEENKYNKRLLKHKRVKTIFASNSLTKKSTKKLEIIKLEEIYGKN